MANRFKGSYRDTPKVGKVRGIARHIRSNKRAEAVLRNEYTVPSHRRSFRMDDVTAGEFDPDTMAPGVNG